jgi:hypothetical protein
MNLKESLVVITAFVSDMANAAVESKSVSAVVAGSTLGLGLSNLQTLTALVATCCGIVLSLLLIIRNMLGAWQDWKKHWEEPKLEGDNDAVK